MTILKFTIFNVISTMPKPFVALTSNVDTELRQCPRYCIWTGDVERPILIHPYLPGSYVRKDKSSIVRNKAACACRLPSVNYGQQCIPGTVKQRGKQSEAPVHLWYNLPTYRMVRMKLYQCSLKYKCKKCYNLLSHGKCCIEHTIL